jgi:hypothetical protein
LGQTNCQTIFSFKTRGWEGNSKNLTLFSNNFYKVLEPLKHISWTPWAILLFVTPSHQLIWCLFAIPGLNTTLFGLFQGRGDGLPQRERHCLENVLY